MDTSNTETKQLRFYRLRDIVGDVKNGIPAIIPVSKTSWYRGIREGKFPKPVMLSEQTSAWRSTDIDALVEKLSKGNHDEEDLP
ncbi:AlpA family phage regulatory protein [Prosthecochloris sp.]|uniref:helix-turn-helix transcriptional regulator n=1 Tax=Prosthecochloris sp. TaxID=290513 RepID=UPI0025EF842F|nr:AlpA family phage regulatory protein [Prosthecochloris sp.]